MVTDKHCGRRTLRRGCSSTSASGEISMLFTFTSTMLCHLANTQRLPRLRSQLLHQPTR